jgi:hypothetical protein
MFAGRVNLNENPWKPPVENLSGKPLLKPENLQADLFVHELMLQRALL